MKIALVEDEKTHQDYIAGLFENAAKKLGIPLSMRVFESGESFLFSLEDEKPDAVLLDIQLQNMNGYEIAETIRKKDKHIPIAFITGEKDYVFDGYKVDACGYLLKPVDIKAVTGLLSKINEKISFRALPLMVKTKDGIINIYQSDIYYIESDNHNTKIVTEGGTYLSGRKLSEWEKVLYKDSFYKPYRSYIINLGKIDMINKGYCVMGDKTEVPIARGQWKLLMKAYLSFRRKDYK